MAARRKPSKDQVKAWLNTVIAPLLGALRVERDRLERRASSFRCHSLDFEFLGPTNQIVSPAFLPNLAQLCRFHPNVAALAKRHDEGIETLRKACIAAFDQLLASPEFRRLAADTRTAPDDDRYFAEYVVNGARELPPHYSLRDVWAVHGDSFLALRGEAALTAAFDAVNQIGGRLAKVVVDLQQAIESLQASLADQFGLPPVDPVSAALT